MLQHTPEYKRLPLHHIHSRRRLSTRDSHFSASDTASHAPSSITKTEPTTPLCNGTLAHPAPHGGKYYVAKNRTQPYIAAPLELAPTIWPPHITNYWFPNWKELFHGFVVVQNEPSRQVGIAGSEGIMCIQQQQTDSFLQSSGSKIFQPGFSTALTSISNRHQPTNTTLSSCERQRQHAHTVDVPVCTLAPTLDVTNSQAMSKSLESNQSLLGDANKVRSSHNQPSKSDLTKCSLKSPLWLPQGWTTELHVRRTGTTAGTRDKYFRHLTSGRRFRTRKDVLHFINTGKRRTRKQKRSKEVRMLCTGNSLMKAFVHNKHQTPEALRPLSHCWENKSSAHSTTTLIQGQSVQKVDYNFENLPKKPKSLCPTGSLGLQGKATTKPKAHKATDQEKSDILSSKIGDDGQTSKLWQWLTKPVAKDTGTPSGRELFTLSFSSPRVEKEVAKMTQQRRPTDMRVKNQTAQKTTQLSNQIQAAQNDMLRVSKEMQATAEKLSREILVAQKDAEFDNQLQVSNMPSTTGITLANYPEAGKSCRQVVDTLSSSYLKTGLATSKHHTATEPLPETTKNSCSMTGIVPRLEDISGILKGHLKVRAATQQAEICSIPSPVKQPTTWLNNISLQPQDQRVKVTHTALANGTLEANGHGNDIKHAAQPATTALNQTVECHVVATVDEETRAITLAKRNFTQSDRLPEVQPVPMNTLLQTPSSWSMNKAESCALKSCAIAQPVNEVKDDTHTTNPHVQAIPKYFIKPDVVAEAKDSLAARMQTCSTIPLAEVPAISNKKEVSVHVVYVDAAAKGDAIAAEGMGTLIHEKRLGTACTVPEIQLQEEDIQEALRRQVMEEVKARYLRKKKFSPVLNPKLDLSRLSPTLTTRKRAKVVERMKASRARELLATLGKHLCRQAVRCRHPWASP